MGVANSDLCGADTTYFTIDVWTNELIELKSEIQIYPNPASDLIHVHHEGGGFDSDSFDGCCWEDFDQL